MLDNSLTSSSISTDGSAPKMPSTQFFEGKARLLRDDGQLARSPTSRRRGLLMAKNDQQEAYEKLMSA
nr:hypothetical protein [Rhizobium sophoriradicis]